MKWPRWSIVTTGSQDFLPVMIGVVFLILSVPAFFMVLFNADPGSQGVGTVLLVILGAGIVIGASFVLLGLRICSLPGSRLYRITHGRIFSR